MVYTHDRQVWGDQGREQTRTMVCPGFPLEEKCAMMEGWRRLEQVATQQQLDCQGHKEWQQEGSCPGEM
jgi:hypothetical protein